MGGDRYLVTAALPYANGPIHIGHAIGCYIPADVYTRYRRLRGDDVVYICGTDEHGTPITVSAEKEGVSPREIVDKYHGMHLEAFKAAGVEFDNFSGTAREIHYELSQAFFRKVDENGYIHRETVERPYCPSCGRFLPDRYVKGRCPDCGSEDERGDQCEACGKQLEPHELVDPYCDICRETPEMRETEHWFFELSELSDKLGEWLRSGKLSSSLPNNARNFALGWIKEGLKDRAITRDMTWGIPVPVEGADGKVLYVWFDAPIGYISSTKEWSEGRGEPGLWKDYWLGENDCKVVHFIGKDNIPFHIVIWPAMLMAEGSYNLPWQVASNEFLNLEGRKMSTSRGWVIWLHDILEEFEADAVRYYLLSIAPETSDSDFKLEEFQDKVNKELIGTLGNFINRTLTFIKSKKDGVVPNMGVLEDLDKDFMNDIKACSKDVGGELERFKLKHAQDTLLHYAQKGNVYFQNREPWKGENDTSLYLCANLCRSLAILMHPFLPFSAEKVWKMLGLEGGVAEQTWDSAGELRLEGRHRIGEVSALYSKIEDDSIAEFKKRYLPIGEGRGKEEVKEMVDYEEFNKVDLRVATVKKIEDHPNADKLVLLTIDVGSLGERQIVAGIKEAYKSEDLVGRQIIVVANLKPAKIRGVESNGMLLAADEDGNPILLQPDRKVKPGSRIH
ncbi:MAG: methionine--tRNA ligase [Candidatus Altiarchaeales archaeon]|nr:methionine--tRNA ligase [Candidatus Altiarchaeales archaeon]MBD3416844.1 methionine--tRNA ligase [Candidatus Altiarchaeales archaeon]